MGIYLLVQKTVVHNSFADSAKYVSTCTVHSSNRVKSFFYSNNDDDLFLHRWNFRLNTICRSLRNGDLFTGPKDYCSQFFTDSAKYVSTATVHSSKGIKPFFYSNNDDDFFLHRWNFRLNTICRRLRNGDLFTGPKDYCSQFFTDSAKYVSTATVHSYKGIKSFFFSKNGDDFFLHRWDFRLNTICRSLRNGDLFTGPKDYCSQFLWIPQSTFPLLQSTVERESSRSSTQRMGTTSSYIVETFV